MGSFAETPCVVTKTFHCATSLRRPQHRLRRLQLRRSKIVLTLTKPTPLTERVLNAQILLNVQVTLIVLEQSAWLPSVVHPHSCAENPAESVSDSLLCATTKDATEMP